MKLAVLFWFYKEVDICKNRIKLIKKYNPKIKIFGLYGGDKKKAKYFNGKLKNYLDDFYISAHCNKHGDWKWINGDLMILDWYNNQGRELKNWDSVVIVQWDALVLGNIKKQFSGIKKGEIFISGIRILDKYIEEKWSWTKLKSDERKNYLNFQKYVMEKYGYKNKLLCSLFILQIFSRDFFNCWLTVEDKEIGMLEYKIPTYAKIFNIPIYRKDLGVWWFNKNAKRGETPLNARGVEVKEKLINSELNKKNGFRIFHPYFKIWNS